MELKRRKLSGLYFVVDPTMPRARLFDVLEAALLGGVQIVQVWSAWKARDQFVAIVEEIRAAARRHGAPMIVNNDLEMARRVGADGVHMDGYELSPERIRRKLGETCLVGYTVGNDMARVRWAEKEGADYVSFCSIFPSASVVDCDIVPLRTLEQSRKATSIPIFASGGISLENARAVLEAGADGIAVISAIQKALDPEGVARQFKAMIDLVLADRTR